MSDIFLPNEGEIGFLQDGGPLSTQYKLALYTAPTAIDADTVLADLTLATFTGSSPVVLDDWTGPVIAEDGSAEIEHPAIVFTRTGGATEVVLGAVVYNDSASEIRWVAPDPGGGFSMAVAGATYTVIPRFRFRTRP